MGLYEARDTKTGRMLWIRLTASQQADLARQKRCSPRKKPYVPGCGR